MTSYAVSPQSTFTCPPCSVRLRQQGIEPPRRLSYCSITTPKPRLQCFSEISSSSLGQGREFHTFSAEVQNAESPIIHLELLAADEEDGVLTKNKLLAIHIDGEIRCFSQDLQFEEWKKTIKSESGGVSVEFAVVISLEEARQSLLKNREDISAMLGDFTDVKNIPIMLLVTRSPQMAFREGGTALSLRIIQVGASIGTRVPVVELVSFTLPEMDGLRLEDLKYSWHGASGSLLQSTSTTLSVHDLSGSVPQLRHHLKLGDNKFASCLRLSPSTVALAREESISIIDMQYHSLQARCILELSPKHLSKAVKHKLRKNTRNDLLLTSYFAHLDLVTALRGRELVAVQLSKLKQNDGESRKRKRDSLLINSLGRAFSSIDVKFPESVSSSSVPKSLGKFLPSGRSLDGWTKQKEALDSCLAQEDFDGFERLMAAELGVVERGTESTHNGFSNDADHPFDMHSFNICKVHYVLAKIFTLEKHQISTTENSTAIKLKISWFPSKICRRLIGEGLFSPNQIEAALKIYGSLSADESLKYGEYTQAVTRWDETLETLRLILGSPVPLETNEIAHCISQLIRFTNSSEKHDDIKLLTNGNIPAIDGLEQGLQKFVAIDSASSLQRSDQGSSFHTLLDSILIRLTTHARSKVSQALRAELSSLELRNLADLLRVQLAEGQWLSSCVETNQNHAIEEFPKNGQINTIAMLLNCAIDSLGTGGWVLGASVTEEFAETADTIAYMKAEISAALEGIEEATYLKGMLGEILLFANNSRRRNQNPLPIDQFISQARSSTTNISDAGEFLPLGLRGTHVVPGKKVGAGGEILKRKQRDIGRLKSHMVGKYSFDRIRI